MDGTNHFGEENLSVFDAFWTKSRLVSCTYYQNASACWFLPLFSHDAHDLDNVITGFLLKHHLYFHHKGVEDLFKLQLLHLKSGVFEICLADFCRSALLKVLKISDVDIWHDPYLRKQKMQVILDKKTLRFK